MATDDEIIAKAEAAGLGKAAGEFRDDVLAAARSAEDFRAGLGAMPDPRHEPWPPMRVRGRS